MKTTKKLTLSAVMVAMSTVLLFVSKLVPSLPNGGQITLASMVPVIFVSLLLGTKWGLVTSFVYALIQMMTGFYPPPTQNFLSFVAVIMLDYIIAFGCLGFAHFFGRFFKNDRIKYSVSAAIVVFIRYVCHIFSGVIIWGVYTPKGQGVWAYSILYNGSYMIPEIIISSIVISLIIPVLKRRKLFDTDKNPSKSGN